MATSVGKSRRSMVTRSRSVFIEPKRAARTALRSKTAGDDLLDWDVWLEHVPARPERTVLARFEHGGRDQPMPIGPLEDE